jgi:hypothetical protein
MVYRCTDTLTLYTDRGFNQAVNHSFCMHGVSNRETKYFCANITKALEALPALCRISEYVFFTANSLFLSKHARKGPSNKHAFDTVNRTHNGGLPRVS